MVLPVVERDDYVGVRVMLQQKNKYGGTEFATFDCIYDKHAKSATVRLVN